MEMLIWEYTGKCYLEINVVKLKEVKVENGFNKDHPYILEFSFSKYDFRKMESRLQVIAFLKLIKCIDIIYIHIYRMGLPESVLKPFGLFITL